MLGETYDGGHLGGYIIGGDPATWYPELWDWLVEEHGVASVLDVGCGEGHSTRYFRDLGCYVIGVDGVAQDDPDIVQIDFTEEVYHPIGEFDMVWCCEVLEHVEEQFLPNLSESFLAAPLLLVTHADPDQPGHHHVNCKTEDYWRGYFAGIGYHVNDGLTGHTRGLAGLNDHPLNHYARSGLVLERYE